MHLFSIRKILFKGRLTGYLTQHLIGWFSIRRLKGKKWRSKNQYPDECSSKIVNQALDKNWQQISIDNNAKRA